MVELIGIIIILISIVIWYFSRPKNTEKTVDKSKRLKKFLFFWIIFHSLGYLSFLLDFHPSIIKDDSHSVYYVLTAPEHRYGTDNITDESGFYPFLDFTELSYGDGYTYFTFLGIYGCYGTSEYLFYVVLPLSVIGLVWIYRKYIA